MQEITQNTLMLKEKKSHFKSLGDTHVILFYEFMVFLMEKRFSYNNVINFAEPSRSLNLISHFIFGSLDE